MRNATADLPRLVGQAKKGKRLTTSDGNSRRGTSEKGGVQYVYLNTHILLSSVVVSKLY